MTTLTKTQTKASEQTQVGLDSVSKTSIGVMGGISALIGLWAAACFVGALISDGPLGLIKGWFAAITGM